MRTIESRRAIALSLMAILCAHDVAKAESSSSEPQRVEDSGGMSFPIQDKLQSQANSSTRVKSKFDYTINSKLRKLKGKVKIPIPNESTGIVDQTTAEDALITMSLAHLASNKPEVTYDPPYALCTLVFEEIKSDKAQYGFEVKQNKGAAVRLKQGTCDVDLGTEGIQPGVPRVQGQDQVTVEYVIDPPPETGPATVPLGQGKF